MGIYSKYLFPRLMNAGMSGELTGFYRKEILTHARGKILEIGFGTGLNLPYYPASVKKIHTIDVNAGMNLLAFKHMEKSAIQVEYHIGDAKQLPFGDAFFDTVVSTWTLCSIKNISKALEEIYRVLKPEGKFLFVEHGLSNEAHIQKWQHVVTPIQKVMADGCHVNRNIETLIQGAGFRFETLTKQYAKGVPKVAGYLYYGIGRK
ncbi:class I SAM-dependent methyltransferase [Rhodocytophaga aerolata]|uniref:Class I SAM-dependent methyltransferase n=1 Tax=Rhodocytophaga aerolata TaxID=455078 RepID=A0ABT8R8I5_9BACT|nr:class I SAM-dependent methyltransferase [Rhodocytophaga aerolata]MDO1448415.1 class I SAM-dependent methyltransferase [Rhodocytophaga aerolata]